MSDENPDSVLSSKGYPAFAAAEWFAIINRNNLAFRFGPYTGTEIGQIMERCNAEKIPMAIVANCGPAFDWELARDIRGRAGELQMADLLRKMRENNGECIADHPDWIEEMDHLISETDQKFKPTGALDQIREMGR